MSRKAASGFDRSPSPSSNGERTARGRFSAGNKHGRGRPAGSRNQATLVLEKMLADDGAEVVKAVLLAAKRGDMQAARMVLDRIVPPRKGRPLRLQLPEIATAGDVVAALGAVIKEMAAGSITPDEAATIAGVLAQLGGPQSGGQKPGDVSLVEMVQRIEAEEAAAQDRLAETCPP